MKVIYEVRDKVARITLNRPEVMNAMDAEVYAELSKAWEDVRDNPDVWIAVITGAGERAFAAGADIRELAGQTLDGLADDVAAGAGFGHWDRLKAIRMPLIAAVRGFALGGGCELAMTCDMIVAGDDATFGQPEIAIGVMPGAGGTQRLTRAIGSARAMELILTGRSIGAAEAERLGLVTRVVPADATLDAALELAARIAGMPPLAVRAAKAAVRDASERPLSIGLAEERAAFFALFDTEDQAEGMQAFTDKRAPVWSGR